jgi:hypothetical protein
VLRLSTTLGRSGRLLALLGVACAGAVGCGASINAVYEGDVRFEHCMALDSVPNVKPTIRRACWEEWIKFYTFGQTRDRVDYAMLRRTQLGAASDFDEGEWAPTRERPALAAPEPTSALAPPPAMLTSSDAGAPNDGGGAAHEGDHPTPNSECSVECEDGWNLCRQDCKTPACEKACTGKYKRCMRRCL